ncbi:hypothetical protein BLA29_000411 [Euroglyphus maynei]|uniref:mRNA-decapping enzyme C-terminal domain-containing protein n=1 Tax=Euroglyphus maynei TaxID=6958 RepID=A0A1Y3AXJ4_EURMA|nr:hypothetical protein BLA29_000411 [Euroglyphus maynei]
MVDLNEDSINLRALKKIDDNIREIIICAGQVAVYYYDINQNDWVRKNIEGTLFFVRRSNQPEYAFVVINRLNTINFVQKITKDLEINVQSPYLMYKNIEKEIYCIWFYDANQCATLNENINQAMNSIKKTPDTSSKILNGQSHTPKSKQQSSLTAGTPSTNNDQAQASQILKLFYNNKTFGISGDNVLPPPDSMKPQMLINHLNENHLDNVSSEQTLPQKSVDDLVKPIAQRRSVNLKELFESQLVLQETSNTSLREIPQQLANNDESELTNKPQSSTPSSKKLKQTPNKNESVISSSPMNSSTFMTDDLKKKSLTSVPNSMANPPSSSSSNPGLLLMPESLIYPTEPQHHSAGNDIIRDEPQQMMPNMPQQSIHPSLIPYPINFEPGFQHALPPTLQAQPPPPHVLNNNLANCIPNVFEIQHDHQMIQQQQQQQQQQSVTPIAGRTSISKSDMYLSMEQLKKTLIYLLSNDADFLHAIHTAYVENIKK